MAKGKPNETLIAFESGHYKKIRGAWLGDSMWSHFKKDAGGMVHVNKDKAEYMETFGPGESPADPDKHDDKDMQGKIDNINLDYRKAQLDMMEAEIEQIRANIERVKAETANLKKKKK